MFNINVFSDWINSQTNTGSAEEEFTGNSTIIDEECPPQNGSNPINSTIVDMSKHESYASEAGKTALYVFLGLLTMACLSFLSYKISQSMYSLTKIGSMDSHSRKFTAIVNILQIHVTLQF